MNARSSNAPGSRFTWFGSLAIASLVGCAATASDQQPTARGAQDSKHASAAAYSAPGDHPEMVLPPGWTADDMQACMLAGTPGKMHEHLAEGVGVWEGKGTMWMAPGMEPMQSECTLTTSVVMDGRYTKGEMAGDMPGMGLYSGFGLTGFDNVSQKFVSTWIDNHSTGMMQGVGELSADGKTLTWKFNYNCPITKKPAVMREIHRTTGERTMTYEMFNTDPKSGKEFKMMVIDFTKRS